MTELLAIVPCAAVGLTLGRALLFLLGRTTRRHDLAAAGRGSAPVVLGALVLFGPAGLREGSFRQLVLHDIARWSVAAGSLLLWAAYLVGARRRPHAHCAQDRLEPTHDDEAFLEAYHAALRGDLEGRLRLGRRKRDKHTPEAAG